MQTEQLSDLDEAESQTQRSLTTETKQKKWRCHNRKRNTIIK